MSCQAALTPLKAKLPWKSALRNTGIPASLHCTCLLQTSRAYKPGTECLAEKGNSKLPQHIPELQLHFFPPCTKVQALFSIQDTQGSHRVLLPDPGGNAPTPVCPVMNVAVTLSVKSQQFPSPDRRQKCLAGFAKRP